MENESTTTDNLIDGGTPTPQEAALTQELANENAGTPTAAPAAAPAPAPAAATPSPAVVDPNAAAAVVDAAASPAASPAAAPAPAAPDPTAAVAQAASQALISTPPAPPKDFDTEYASLQQRYDAGEVDAVAYQKELRALTREESSWTTKLEIWQHNQTSVVERAKNDFNTMALDWEARNQSFMANPLRATAMQQAIAAVDAQTPGLAPNDLLSRAEKIAFEAYDWKGSTDGNAAVAAAVQARTPSPTPATLAAAPAAGPIDPPQANTQFAGLDALDINQLENALAAMPAAQREAYLRSSPGSNATGE
jgi:hypothetical protein